MKKALLIILISGLCSLAATAQKVGITDATGLTPQSLLHVHSATAGQLFQLSTGTTPTANSGFNISIDTYKNIVFNQYEAAKMAFYTNNTERLTVLSDGNVGIGTAAPASKLDINGNVNVAAGNGTRVTIGAPTSAGTTMLIGRLSGNPSIKSSDTYLMLEGGGVSGIVGLNYYATGAVLLAYGGGNVGIGTTSPTQKLDVNGVVNAATGYRIANAAATGGNYLRGNGTNFVASGIQVSDVPVLNQNTTGTAANVSGIVAPSNGGTGVNNGSNTLIIPASGTAVLGTGTTNYNTYWSGTNTLGSEQFVNVSRGGLGANMTATAIGAIPYASSTSAYSTLPAVASGNALISGGTGTAPSWGKIGLTTHVSGTLAVGNGGTGASSLTGILQGNGTSAVTGITGTANYVPKWSASAPYLTTTSQIFDNGTNVGIATVAPAAKLHILGTVAGDATALTGGILIENNNATSGEAAVNFKNVSTGTNYWFTGLNQSEHYDIAYGAGFTNAVTTIRVQANGYVGIGTVTPGQKLDVSGGSIRTTNQLISSVATGTAPLAVTSTTKVTNLNVDRIDDYHAGNASGNIPISNGTLNTNLNADLLDGYHASSFAQAANAYVQNGNSFGALATLGTNDAYNLGFETDGTTRMTINTSGSVGIGITSPSSKLDISEVQQSEFHGSNSAFPIANLIIRGTGTSRTLGTGSAIEFVVPANTDGSNPWAQARILGTPDNSSNGNAEGALYLQTRANYDPGTGGTWNWRTNMVLRASGNVGIGTTSPGQKLDVSGGSIRTTNQLISTIGIGTAPIVVTSTTAVANLNADMLDGYHYNNLPYLTNANISGTTNYVSKFTGTNAIGVSQIFDNGTSVGVGNASPTQKLDVSGNIKSTGYGILPAGTALAASGAPDGKIFSPSGDYLGQTNWGINYNEGAPDYIEFNNGSGPTSRIALDDGSAHFGLNGGKVGIGMTTPAETLDINGSLDWTTLYWDASENISMRGAGEFSFDFADGDGNDYWHVWDPTHSTILTVRNNGFVGIGTASPSTQLHTTGGVRFQTLTGTGSRFVMADANGNLSASSAPSANIVSGNGVATRVAFWSNANTLSSNANLYWDNTNTRLGIGTASPGSKLTIAGTGQTPLLQLSSVTMSSVQGNDLVMRNLGQLRFSDGNDWDWNTWAGIKYVQSETKLVIGGPASSYFSSNASPPNVTVVFDGISNVGIGTTSPAQKLHIIGTTRITDPYYSDRYIDIYGSAAQIIQSTNDLYIQPAGGLILQPGYPTSGTGNIEVKDGGGNVYTTFVGSTQRVGIGTSSPGYRLDLASGTFAFGNGNVRTETRNDAGLQGNSGAQSGFFETSSPSNYPSGATNWWHLIDCRHSNNSNNYALQIAGSFYDQNLYFRKTNNNSTQAWSQIMTSNNISGTTNYVAKFTSANAIGNSQIYDNGNVGIGTTSPAEKLDVSGNIKSSSLAGTGNRPVYANANGVLKAGANDNTNWTLSANFSYSPDDLWDHGGTSGGSLSADDTYASYEMPFSIVIEGTSYSTLTISTNGWVAFGTVTSSYFTNYSLPTSTFSVPVICAYWDDIRPEGNYVRYGYVGTSPNRTVIIDYEAHTYSGDYDVRFQVQIHEGSGLINVKYRDVMSHYANGQSATIGFQLAGGSSAKAYPISYNGKVLDDNRDDAEGWSVCPVR